MECRDYTSVDWFDFSLGSILGVPGTHIMRSIAMGLVRGGGPTEIPDSPALR
jgi:hypothetical protein